MTSVSERTNSASVEDYVKAIFSLTAHDRPPASTNDLADTLQISAGSVSAMLKRLASYGLIEHVPYHGVRLTAAGQQLALGVIRRHRLLELLLHDMLDVPWHDVHRFADQLEHAVSDELTAIIARRLGDPTVDPHGDPIPNHALQLADPDTRRLDQLAPGEHGTLTRVSDADPDLLRYLTDHGISIGTTLQMNGRQPFDGPYDIQTGDRTLALGPALVAAMRVS